ncbi:MAG: sulfur reduction protein DsrJ [Gammaproteobacteria bacterium]|nr:sulfur reduction protein DsrJ [Gammaproteobacteria bacterium]
MLKNSFILLLLAFTAGFAMQGQAGDSLLPEIPEAQARFSEAQGCVEPTAEMRKNHMDYILHQRDETMYEGIRTRQYSLNECINCHVSDAEDAPRVSSEEHFCNSCHSYAAVKVDCFQCHADRPVKTSDNQSFSTTGKPALQIIDSLHALETEGTVHE